jgi:branched-subunit amino acid transport protein
LTGQWIALCAASVGCYLLKLAGVALPQTVLNDLRVKRIAGLLPIAMLAALTVVQLFDRNGHYGADWRTVAGVGAGAVALLAKQSLIVVFLVAVAVTAVLRLVT